MVTNKIKALTAAREKVAALEQSIARQLRRELAGLPQQYGFSSMNEFIAAVREAGGSRRGRKPGRAAAGGGGAARRRRRRAKITDETRTKVKDMVKAGKTGGEIASALKISLPSVQNIKKALGLVKGRK